MCYCFTVVWDFGALLAGIVSALTMLKTHAYVMILFKQFDIQQSKDIRYMANKKGNHHNIPVYARTNYYLTLNCFQKYNSLPF